MDKEHIDGAWALRLYYKPFIRWLWFGGLMMMLGGFVSAGDRRFRVRRPANADAPEPVGAALLSETRA